MAAKTDVQVGLHAEVYATHEQVTEACQKAAEVLGKRATAVVTPAKVTVSILPGLVTSLSPVSPLVGISLAPGGDGKVVIDARIEKYRTAQSTFMMIPVGPKTLVGKGTYLSLLKSLEQELRAVDRGQGSVRRTSAAGLGKSAVAIKLAGCLAVGVTAAGTLVLGGCASSAPSFQVGNCINWSIDSSGNSVPMKVSCNNPPDPDIDVVKAIVSNGQSCTIGDRFYTQADGSTLCLEDEYVMSPGG